MKPTPQALLQVLGQNMGAQDILKDILQTEYPELEQKYNMSDQIVDRFFDWLFPFVYTEDGGGARRWRTAVRSWCGRNSKLKVLEDFYEASGTDGTFNEVYSGSDITKFTDNRASENTENFTDNREEREHATFTDNRKELQSTDFSATGQTTTSGLGDSQTREYETGRNNTDNEVTRGFTGGKNTTLRNTTQAFQNGRNTTEQEYTRGTRRTYSDGRTWVQILKDIEEKAAPVYDFINGFAYILIDPAQADCCDIYRMPSVAAFIDNVSGGAAAAVEVENAGTPLNANFGFKFTLPRGEQGDKGEDGRVVTNLTLTEVST